jgi:peptidyl-prolyl cis-trans isomerase D
MLQNIHDKVKGWFAAILLGFISLTFAMWGVSNYFNHGSGDVTVAKINGTAITEHELDTAFKQFQQRQQEAGLALPNTPEADKAIKQELLQSLIARRALLQRAQAAHYLVTPGEMEGMLMQLPQLQVDGQFSQQRFSLLLSNLQLTREQYFAQLHDELLMQQVQASFLSTAFALPSDLQRMMNLRDQTRQISYAILSQQSVRENAPITEGDIKTYYEKHTQQFQIPEQVQLAYVVLSLDALTKQTHVADTELRQYYDENKDNFFIKGHQQTFEEATPAIRQLLAQRKAEQQFAADAEKLANLSYENPNSLVDVAKTLNLTVMTTPFIDRQGSADGLTSNKAVLTQAFSEEVYTQGYNSSVININDREQIVIRIAQKKPSTIKPLSEVQQQILALLKQQGVQQQLQQKTTDIVQALNKGKTLPEIAQQYQLQWKIDQMIDRKSVLPVELVTQAFNLKPKGTSPVAADVALGNGDRAVIVLNRVISGANKQLSATEKARPTQEVERSYGLAAFDHFYQSVLRQAKIKINS